MGQIGIFPVLAGKGAALICMRAANCTGVKLPFTERINAAMPDTMGVAKLVPRLGFCSLV